MYHFVSILPNKYNKQSNPLFLHIDHFIFLIVFLIKTMIPSLKLSPSFLIGCILCLVILYITFSSRPFFEMYDESQEIDDKRPPGPWGKLGTRLSWQDYPYVLNWINY
jgi:hypothetical protein